MPRPRYTRYNEVFFGEIPTQLGIPNLYQLACAMYQPEYLSEDFNAWNPPPYEDDYDNHICQPLCVSQLVAPGPTSGWSEL